MKFQSLLRTAGAAAALAFATASAQAVTVTYDFAVPGDGSGRTSPYAGSPGFTTNTFDAPSTGTYSGNYSIYASSNGNSASPAGNSTSFFSVPNPQSSGTATLTLGDDYNYFGLNWGSIDSYNTIAFYLDGTLVEDFTGSELPPPAVANGNQISDPSNRYVNFDFGSQSYDEVRFTSTNFAFESDNHTFGRIPEPATLALLGAGLIGLGAVRRRKTA